MTTRFGTLLFGLSLLLSLAALPVLAESELDQVLRRYEEARGGVAAWRATETLSASGIYASFSHRKAFRLEMRQPSYYHFDTESLGGRALFARDEKGPYWIFAALGTPAWPTRVENPAPYAAMVDRQALFEPPLMDARAKGHRVELIGRGDIDGTAVIVLELTLASGDQEKWYLDPVSGLEVAIDATIFDFTQTDKPVAERSFPSDFRKVGKIVVPHKVEKEYLARYSLLEIHEIKVNEGWPAEKFRMPDPPPEAAEVKKE